MKKSALILIGTLGLAGAGLAHAAAYHSPGYVWVSAGSMSGQFNVRYNTTDPGSPYIMVQGNAGASVWFSARDSAGNLFVCYVPTTSALYNAAVGIMNGAGNGTALYVTKPLTSNECTQVMVYHSSYAID